MKTHPVVLMFAILMFASLGSLTAVLVFGHKESSSSRNPSEAGCACAAQANPQHKFLIFWKQKDVEGYKVSEKLFDSVVDAWKTVPPTAAEVRIVTVRID